MSCEGCFDDFAGEWGIIEELGEPLWVDDEDLNPPPPPLLGRKLNRSPRRKVRAAVQYHPLVRKECFYFQTTFI